jgi:TetR/AcrR family transcriptional regulator, transcriptional repressor of aconitase
VPKVSQEHLDARRAQILAGAQRAFARHGYGGATVVRLEEETGLSRGAIFSYFGNKQDLFVALATDVSRRYTEGFADGGLDAVVRAMAAEDPELLAVIVETEARLLRDPEFSAKMDAASRRGSQALTDWFAARQADGTFRRDVEARELARFAAMIVNGLALRVLAGDETDLDVLLRLLHDALAPRT